MTPIQNLVSVPVNSKAKFEEYQKATVDYSSPKLTEVTKTILDYAFWLAEQKQYLSLEEYKKLLCDQGWEGEEKKYLKIAAAFGKFSAEDFAQVEPRTIYQLAENRKKYQPVIDRLLDSSEITQATVRSLTKKQRTGKKSPPEKPTIWRRTKNGGRYCQIPPIHENSEQTGTMLQKMMDEEGLSAQKIIAEAIALRQAYQEGRLLDKSPSHVKSN